LWFVNWTAKAKPTYFRHSITFQLFGSGEV